ncbi:MAG: hypothetical protein ABI137_16060 [Antricoccus sp.]
MEYSELVAATQPNAVMAALAANAEQIATAGHAHGGDEISSLRQATHNGHQITVRTTYQITVDGQPFDVHLTVDNKGRVHYHGLPTRDFASVIGLVEKAIDVFPADFATSTDSHPHGGDSAHDHRGDASPGHGGGH